MRASAAGQRRPTSNEAREADKRIEDGFELNGEKSMTGTSLRDVVSVASGKWRALPVAVGICAAAAYGMFLSAETTWEAATTLRIGRVGAELPELEPAGRLVEKINHGYPVTSDSGALVKDDKQRGATVTATVMPGTENRSIQIRVIAPNPDLASAALESYLTKIQRVHDELFFSQIEDLQNELEIIKRGLQTASPLAKRLDRGGLNDAVVTSASGRGALAEYARWQLQKDIDSLERRKWQIEHVLKADVSYRTSAAPPTAPEARALLLNKLLRTALAGALGSALAMLGMALVRLRVERTAATQQA